MAFCTNCGSQVQDGVKFCPNCGMPMQGGAAPAKPAAPAAPAAPMKEKKSGKALWIVLAIVVALAVIAVATVVIIKLLDGRDSGQTTPPAQVGYADSASGGYTQPAAGGAADVYTQPATGGESFDLPGTAGSGTEAAGSGGEASAPVVSSPKLPSPDVWLGGGIGRRTDQDNRLYRTVSFSMQETGERAAQDAIDGYIELLQDPRFGLQLIDSSSGNSQGTTETQTYCFRYTGSGTVGDLSEMGTWDAVSGNMPSQGTAVRVRVAVILGMTYNFYIDYVSEFEFVDEGDCFSDVGYLKEYVPTGLSF